MFSEWSNLFASRDGKRLHVFLFQDVDDDLSRLAACPPGGKILPSRHHQIGHYINNFGRSYCAYVVARARSWSRFYFPGQFVQFLHAGQHLRQYVHTCGLIPLLTKEDRGEEENARRFAWRCFPSIFSPLRQLGEVIARGGWPEDYLLMGILYLAGAD